MRACEWARACSGCIGADLLHQVDALAHDARVQAQESGTITGVQLPGSAQSHRLDAGAQPRYHSTGGALCTLTLFGNCAPVAQLDRVPGFEPGGRRFESFRARHFCHTYQQDTTICGTGEIGLPPILRVPPIQLVRSFDAWLGKLTDLVVEGTGWFDARTVVATSILGLGMHLGIVYDDPQLFNRSGAGATLFAIVSGFYNIYKTNFVSRTHSTVRADRQLGRLERFARSNTDSETAILFVGTSVWAFGDLLYNPSNNLPELWIAFHTFSSIGFFAYVRRHQPSSTHNPVVALGDAFAGRLTLV